MATRHWSDLEGELDLWRAAGRRATLWWRDDDAVRPTPALDRLLALAAGLPLALAVIPDQATGALAERVANHPELHVLQHGWRHANHAPPDEKRAELGPHRPALAMLDELAAGRQRLALLFGSRARAVLTPPWNRMSEALVPLLRGAGFGGLSMAGARRAAEPSPGLRQVNTHADLVAWRSGNFLGTAPALGLITAHLAARRTGTADADEPTGLLTHHLVMDDAGAAFIAQLVDVTRRHKAARWLDAAEAFAA
ncbi:MAG TPA: hypothetical protein VHT04_15955 [Stellaceae bacterium]|nr:hypothetical protein [Stellaceae bacterium]